MNVATTDVTDMPEVVMEVLFAHGKAAAEFCMGVYNRLGETGARDYKWLRDLKAQNDELRAQGLTGAEIHKLRKAGALKV